MAKDLYALLCSMYDAYCNQVIDNRSWLIWVAAIATFLGAIVTLAKGARLSPLLCAFAAAGCGAWLGSAIAGFFPPTYFVPVTLVIATIGLALGAAFSRLWIAFLLGGCFMVAALGVYRYQVIDPKIQTIIQNGIPLDAVALEQAETSFEATKTNFMSTLLFVDPKIHKLLEENVSHLTLNVFAIAFSSLLAGIVFGGLLPKAARSIFAASLGTFTLMLSAVALLKLFGQEHWALACLDPDTTASQAFKISIAAIWLISLVLNLIGKRRKPAVSVEEQEEEEFEAEPA